VEHLGVVDNESPVGLPFFRDNFFLVLLKGIGRIFFPDSVGNLIAKKKDNRWFILGEFVVLFVGLYLLYYGFLAS
jgi:hypothetical protein